MADGRVEEAEITSRCPDVWLNRFHNIHHSMFKELKETMHWKIKKGDNVSPKKKKKPKETETIKMNEMEILELKIQ